MIERTQEDYLRDEFSCLDDVLTERFMSSGLEDLVLTKHFQSNSDLILSRMPGLKTLYCCGLNSYSMSSILTRCPGIEYLALECSESDDGKVPDRPLKLKYFQGSISPAVLSSILDNCNRLEGLNCNFCEHLDPQEDHDFSLFSKLPRGLNDLILFLDPSCDISSIFASQAMKTLQHIRINYGFISWEIPAFSAPELVSIWFKDSVIPNSVLKSLAKYSTKLKTIRVRIPQMKEAYFPLTGLENVIVWDVTDEWIEILCRNNRNLKSLTLFSEEDLKETCLTHLATLEHLTYISMMKLADTVTPSSILSFLVNRASRPKNIDLNLTLSKKLRPKGMLAQEIKRQKQEGSTFSFFSF